MRIASKYSLLIGVTLLVSVFGVISIAAMLSYKQSDQLRLGIGEAVASSQLIDNEEALRQSAAYIGRRLFSLITDMDISGMNSEIRHAKGWLPISSFLILDDAGVLLTDGSEQNPRMGEAFELPDDLAAKTPLVINIDNTISLSSVIGFDSTIIGYLIITLDLNSTQQRIAKMQEGIQLVWDDFARSAGHVLLAAVVFMSLVLVFLSRRFSHMFARPLTEMSAAAETFARGEFDYRLEIESEDEIGELAHSLNQMADELRVNEQRWQLALDGTTDGVWDLDLTTGAAFVSPQWLERIALGSSEKTISYTRWQALILDEDKDVAAARLAQHLEGKTSVYECEYRIRCEDSSVLWVLDRGQVVERSEAGTATRIIGTYADVSARRQTEEVLRRAQKMEALGQLTGGIAHDFNNLLGIIIGHLDLLETMDEWNDESHEYLTAATKAALRGADLTRQLLRFSRRQSNELSSININQIAEGMDSLIQRSITPQIDVKATLAENLWSVRVHAGELEDALLNLVLNAKDAMPDGGLLEIGTRNIRYEPESIVGISDDSVMLSISDNGGGMGQQAKEHAFEPFFTTKEKGKGTGLGLSMIFGFMQRMNGSVEIQSEENVGTTVRLYFPRHQGPATDQPESKSVTRDSLGGNEHVLIVDDETPLAELAQRYLEKAGYKTSVAYNSKQALAVLSDSPDVKLLFSDVIMPESMDGYALAIAAKRSMPELKILLTSGFTRELTLKYEKQGIILPLLKKPYRKHSLLENIRKELDS